MSLDVYFSFGKIASVGNLYHLCILLYTGLTVPKGVLYIWIIQRRESEIDAVSPET